MKKTCTLLAAVLLSSIAFAQSYTLSLQENTADVTKDNGTIYTKSVEAIFGDTTYVSAINNRDAIYPARENCGAKFGSSSKKGILAFTLATPTLVDSIVIRAAQYSETEGTDGFIMINVAPADTSSFTLSAGARVMESCVWTPADTVTTIRIQQNVIGKRLYVKSFTIYPKTQSDPTALEDTRSGNHASKVFRNGQVLILRGSKTFDILGNEVK